MQSGAASCRTNHCLCQHHAILVLHCILKHHTKWLPGVSSDVQVLVQAVDKRKELAKRVEELEASASDAAQAKSQAQQLERRCAELQAVNAALRKEVKALQVRLSWFGPSHSRFFARLASRHLVKSFQRDCSSKDAFEREQVIRRLSVV
jgi:BMFP domain-containing protein YqiC